MGMSVGGGGAIKSEPNVVPMIDIMLVLLIIFMIVTPIITAGFQAKIPEGRNVVQDDEEDGDVVLGVDNEGRYFLDPGTGEISGVSADALPGYLEQIFSARVSKILYFRADQELDYSYIEDAMDLARKSGVRVLAAVTEQQRSLAGGQ